MNGTVALIDRLARFTGFVSGFRSGHSGSSSKAAATRRRERSASTPSS